MDARRRVHVFISLLGIVAALLAVLDIDMPGRDGLDVTRVLRDQRSATRVILLTLHTDAWFLNSALDAGAQGYVSKESAEALCLSPRTVEHHRASLATKLALQGPHALTRFAIKHQASLRNSKSSSGT